MESFDCESSRLDISSTSAGPSSVCIGDELRESPVKKCETILREQIILEVVRLGEDLNGSDGGVERIDACGGRGVGELGCGREGRGEGAGMSLP